MPALPIQKSAPRIQITPYGLCACSIRVISASHPRSTPTWTRIPDDAQNFISLYNDIYKAVKAEAPDTKIFVTFQWEELNNSHIASREWPCASPAELGSGGSLRTKPGCLGDFFLSVCRIQIRCGYSRQLLHSTACADLEAACRRRRWIHIQTGGAHQRHARRSDCIFERNPQSDRFTTWLFGFIFCSKISISLPIPTT